MKFVSKSYIESLWSYLLDITSRPTSPRYGDGAIRPRYAMMQQHKEYLT
jgi:hypothetical protein